MSDYPQIPEQQGVLGRVLRWVLTHKLVVGVLLVFLVGAGLATAPFDWDLGPMPRARVAVDAIPDIGENQQIVVTDWPGHSPRDVDDQISLPLTAALLGLKDVKTVRSSSMYGASFVYVIFGEGSEFYESRTRLLEKLSSLPPGTVPPDVRPTLGPDATALGQIYWYTLEGADRQGRPTGGWDLEQLRTIQDTVVKYALAAVEGVAEVASVGGYVREYHVELDPDAMRARGIALPQVTAAIREANLDVSARTVELNRVEYFVRGVGLLKRIEDLEGAVVAPGADGGAPVLLRQIASVTLGPARRRGALDRRGVEAVGGVVVARHGANPMRVIQGVRRAVAELEPSLPRKVLIDFARAERDDVVAYARARGFEAYRDGRIDQRAWLDHLTAVDPDDRPGWATVSRLTLVPFYDRTKLIDETLGTLEDALTLEVLVTLLVVIVMVAHLRGSLLIGSMLPLAVLICFIAMRLFDVDANIVALSGIAIAIGTIVDMGIVLCESILRELDAAPPDVPRLEVVHRAASEVGGAVLTAVATTVVSFLPVFTMVGQEGKLFRPLAFTKTFALIASVLVALLVLPPAAQLIFRRSRRPDRLRRAMRWVAYAVLVAGVGLLLTRLWEPLGPRRGVVRNTVFVGGLVASLLILFRLFQWGYPWILAWCLRHKALFLSLPAVLVVLALAVWLGFATVFAPVRGAAEAVGLGDRLKRSRFWAGGTDAFPGLGREFMPRLDEGSFLWMPTISVHGSIAEALDVLSHQDRAFAAIPEVETVVGKIGRVDSALDPAPLSMIETVIAYRPEYRTDPNGRRVRQWRDHIRSPDDIWQEIVRAGRFPGSTSAPKLQPIETRLVMLQTGMTAKMGVKIRGEDLEDIEAAGIAIEAALREMTDVVQPGTVNAERIVGKPYLVMDVHEPEAQRRLQQHGLRAAGVLRTVQAAVGGRIVTYTVEGRQRTAVRVQYQRELRDEIEAMRRVLVPTPRGPQVPLGELVDVRYVRGPQMIRSENTFKVGYVTFGGREGLAEVEVVRAAREGLARRVADGRLVLPGGVGYEFAGAWEAEVRASRTLAFILPVAGLIIFLLLYLQFQSVLNTAIVFLGVIVAFSGGFLLIWLYGRPEFLDVDVLGRSLRDVFQLRPINLSVAVWVGFLALFGIATDDGVVMATYLEQSFRRRRPERTADIRRAVVAAGTRRVRPCLMTTATTLLALLPVLTSTGRGSDIMIPMAIPSFGGMAVEVLTMLVVPVLYCMLRERAAKE